MNLSTYANVLNRNEQDLTLVGEGNNGLVLVDNSGIAYKFPKHKSLIQRLKREIENTNYISGFLSVDVPKYITVDLGRPIGEAYCSYTLIPGTPLSKEIYALHRHKLSRQLLSLIDEIHGIPQIKTMEGNGVDFENMYYEIKDLVFPLVKDSVKQEIELRFTEYLKCDNQQNTCVVHGDFGSSNIICNPITGTITGIIDWAEASVDDPVTDYSSLSCAVSIPMIKEDFLLLRPSLSTIFRRAKFIQYTFPLQEALHGIKADDEIALREGLTAIGAYGQ